jgi:hypothetical protein
MLAGSFPTWLRAWLPETIDAALPKLAVRRGQDCVKKKLARRGLGP